MLAREAHSPASTPPDGGVPSAGPKLDEVRTAASPPKHADSFAPNYRQDRSLRLRASGRQRLATLRRQSLTGTRRAALLGTCARACAPRRHTPSKEQAMKQQPLKSSDSSRMNYPYGP